MKESLKYQFLPFVPCQQRSFGFLVVLGFKLNQPRSDYPADHWFEISGTMIAKTINGKRQLTIQPQNILAIAQPQNPSDY